MATFIRMPRLGMDMEEGTIVKWFINEGEAIKKGEILLEIISDKANMEVESTEEGILLKTYHKPGDVVPVGKAIAAIGSKGETAPEADETSNAKDSTDQENETIRKEKFLKDKPKRDKNEKRIRVSPRAKKLAAEEDIDYRTIEGTGPGGRIIERDIKCAIDRIKALEVIPGTSNDEGNGQIIPLIGMRKIIASRMMQSLNSMAQANHRMDVNMTNTLKIRKRLNDCYENDNIKISILDLIVKAVTKSLKNHPAINSTMTPEGIKEFEYVNMGIAVAARNGLVVPVIPNAHSKSIVEISVKSKEIIAKSREGSLLPEELKGGTFTITNLGMYDVDSFTAIINPPEAGILGIGKICDRAIVENKEIVIRPMCTLSLTYDHRIIDGAPAALFLQEIKKMLENPLMLI